MPKEIRLTSEEVRHLSVLTRINMTDEEVEIMRDQMADILDSIEILSQVDTDGIEPTGHSVDLDSVMREDISSDSISLEDALSNAPLVEGNFIRVRAVLE
ncbi:MAG: Asp-tRNA(Asn)/Glu-tRNA(Gln) amidotransferase subunit GatC [Chloroflexota bacterium]|nr:Asp-tRNA(Asn)/Glu-tRNA(Gln) amidotransferase subunit GatC [Chloroflexota bacterium]|tara:strand:- start:348 stop:647 length:300 start_codon:yes stop_codon:yes gene_type:complete